MLLIVLLLQSRQGCDTATEREGKGVGPGPDPMHKNDLLSCVPAPNYIPTTSAALLRVCIRARPPAALA